MPESYNERQRRSLETRNTEALERIARTLEEYKGTPLAVILRCLQIQGEKCKLAESGSGGDGPYAGWPPLPFEVVYSTDRDDIDSHITVRINNDSGVYLVFTASGFLLDINTSAEGV